MLLKEWLGTGMFCPRRWWNHYPWRHLKKREDFALSTMVYLMRWCKVIGLDMMISKVFSKLVISVILCHNRLHGSLRPCNITVDLWFHESPQCHNGPLVPMEQLLVLGAFIVPNSLLGSTMSPWSLCSMRFGSITWSPWFYEALQYNNGPLVLWGPTVSPWPLGSMRPFSVTMYFLVPWGFSVPQWSPCIHSATRKQRFHVSPSVKMDLGSMSSQSVKKPLCSLTFQSVTVDFLVLWGSTITKCPKCQNKTPLILIWC